MEPPVYLISMTPLMPSDQSRDPVCFMDIVLPIAVVPSTLAEFAPPVFFWTASSAAIGSAFDTAAPSLPLLSSDPPQAATDVSAAATATDRPTRRTVLVLISAPTPLSALGHLTLTHGTDSLRYVYTRTGPAPRKVAGPVNVTRDTAVVRALQAQTEAGSSSTRRLRVRLESSGMPGPIVVARVAFLM